MAKLGNIVLRDRVKITNPDKILWPQDGINKARLLDYFAKISPYILPHLKDRPMVFTRYPEGIEDKFFYQKNLPNYAPKWIKTFTINGINYMLIEDEESLLWAVNQACIEFHPWLSRIEHLDYPDFAVFDFDPMGKTDFESARKLALWLKELLETQGLEGYPKTSGATGLQVYIPIKPEFTYEEVRRFCKFFCKALERTFPQIATTERSIKRREGKLYLDYLQNAKGKTIIAPYSPRPRKGAPVSCPLTWEELELGHVPDMFTIENVPKRLQKIGDLFEKVLINKQDIRKWL